MEKAGTSDHFQPPPQAPPPYQPEPTHAPPNAYHSPPNPYQHPPQAYQQAIYTQPGPGIVRPGVTVVQGVHSVPTGQVIVSQPGTVLVVNHGLSHDPSVINCRSCNHQIVTRVQYMPTCRTHLTALFCCLLGLWPCAFMPYCISSCQKADHYCPNCGVYIGSYL